jgi:hypothetical protein
MTGTNVWGTPRDAVDVDEFCRECEHETGGHYTGCPTRATWINRATYPPPVPAGTYNGRGWQFYVFDSRVGLRWRRGARMGRGFMRRRLIGIGRRRRRRSRGAILGRWSTVVGDDEVARRCAGYGCGPAAARCLGVSIRDRGGWRFTWRGLWWTRVTGLWLVRLGTGRVLRRGWRRGLTVNRRRDNGTEDGGRGHAD